MLYSDLSNVLGISIHAPAWGATVFCHRCFSDRIFQSTLPHGERRYDFGDDRVLLRHFNPRSRMGSDRTALIMGGCTFYFNPRSRMGSDNQ